MIGNSYDRRLKFFYGPCEKYADVRGHHIFLKVESPCFMVKSPYDFRYVAGFSSHMFHHHVLIRVHRKGMKESDDSEWLRIEYFESFSHSIRFAPESVSIFIAVSDG